MKMKITATNIPAADNSNGNSHWTADMYSIATTAALGLLLPLMLGVPILPISRLKAYNNVNDNNLVASVDICISPSKHIIMCSKIEI